MICPSCGSNIPDDAKVCPACRADLFVTRALPRLRGTWCPSCGALVEPGQDRCPKCGMPLATSAPKPRGDRREEAERLRFERQRTNTLPRIESAVPADASGPDADPYERDRLPGLRVVLVAALASLVIVGGAALLIAHPWDPLATDTRATTPADLSHAGYPGTVSRLEGQDRDGQQAVSIVSGDEAAFEGLSSAYDQLAQLSSRADDLLASLEADGVSSPSAPRASGQQSAEQLAIDVSNLVSTIDAIDVTSGTYADTKDHVATLASWLRNRVDALRQSWALSVGSADPVADADKILSPAQQAGGSYAGLFSQSYEGWKPEQAS